MLGGLAEFRTKQDLGGGYNRAPEQFHLTGGGQDDER